MKIRNGAVQILERGRRLDCDSVSTYPVPPDGHGGVPAGWTWTAAGFSPNRRWGPAAAARLAPALDCVAPFATGGPGLLRLRQQPPLSRPVPLRRDLQRFSRLAIP